MTSLSFSERSSYMDSHNNILLNSWHLWIHKRYYEIIRNRYNKLFCTCHFTILLRYEQEDNNDTKKLLISVFMNMQKKLYINIVITCLYLYEKLFFHQVDWIFFAQSQLTASQLKWRRVELIKRHWHPKYLSALNKIFHLELWDLT